MDEPVNEVEQPRVSVRPLQEEDLPQIRPILMGGVVDKETKEPIFEEIDQIIAKMRESLSTGERSYLVAEGQGLLLGVVGIQKPTEQMIPFAKTEDPTELVNLFVLKNAREGGVGRSLVAGLEVKAMSLGHTEILLNSGPRYEEVWGFYDKLFGERIGVLKDCYGPGRDAPVWQKVFPVLP